MRTIGALAALVTLFAAGVCSCSDDGAGGDSASPDAAVAVDGPLPDTPPPDLPAPELQTPDAPEPDAALPDASSPDQALPDLPPDLPPPDLPPPDLPLPDLPLPDLPLPDLPAPDAGPAPVGAALCTKDWCWTAPLPHGNTIDAVRGVGAKVWTAGAGGAVTMRDASGWTAVHVGSDLALHDLWSAAAGDTWAVGDEGLIVHHDGTSWKQVACPVTGFDLKGVWGSGPADVYAVGRSSGYKGVVLHHDGKAWSSVAIPGVSPLPMLEAVWGTGASDVWAVGYDMALHYDGSTWSKRYINGYGSGSTTMYSVWGSGASDVWAATGESANVLYRWTGGTSFNYVKICTGCYGLGAVWGTGPKDIWAAGKWGLVVHYDGTAWSQESGLNSYDSLQAIWRGAAGGDVYAAGLRGIVYRRSGGSWQVETGAPVMTGAHRAYDVRSLWANSASDVYALITTDVLHFDGTSWKAQGFKLMTGYGGAVWGSGKQAWVLSNTSSSNTRIDRFDGTTWQAPVTLPFHLRALWGSGPADIWGVGNSGTIGHYDGKAWTKVGSGVTVDLTAISGSGPADVKAVGFSGTVLHYDGVSWKKAPGPASSDQLMSIWSGSSSVAVIGGYQQVWTWDGKVWTGAPLGSDYLVAVWGSGAKDVYAGDQHGRIYRHDGSAWTATQTGFGGGLGAIHGVDANNIWAGGVGGILRRK